MWARGEVGAGRQADGEGLPRPLHSGWPDSRAEKKTRRQGNQSETNRFPLEVRKSRCCGCWWPVRLQATSISARPYSAGCQLPAFVRGPAAGLLPHCLACLSAAGHPPTWGTILGGVCVNLHMCVHVQTWHWRGKDLVVNLIPWH